MKSFEDMNILIMKIICQKNTSQNIVFPELAFVRKHTSQKLHFPQTFFSKIYTCQKLHLVKITFSRKLIFQNLLLPEETTFLQKFIFPKFHIPENSFVSNYKVLDKEKLKQISVLTQDSIIKN